jgi:hypothetical protein
VKEALLVEQPAPLERNIAGYCGECRYSHLGVQGPFNAHLMCRHSPPHPVIIPNGQNGLAVLGMFPKVERTDTCGEFEPESKQ